MENNLDWKKRNDAIESDPRYIKCREKSRRIADQGRKGQAELYRSVRKVGQLLRLFDAGVEILSRTEDITPEESEVLKKYTTDCGECWRSNWDLATDLQMELGVMQCEIVNKQKRAVQELKRATEVAWQETVVVRETINAELDEKEAKEKAAETEKEPTNG